MENVTYMTSLHLYIEFLAFMWKHERAIGKTLLRKSKLDRFLLRYFVLLLQSYVNKDRMEENRKGDKSNGTN
jgi:hypothetical protein